MERKRKVKIIIMIALMVTIAGMSLGFAAFSASLNVSSSASVTPDSSTFNVVFSSNSSSQASSAITGVGINGATSNAATISGTSISGLQANFTEPGQVVTYTFYAHNVGEYEAYLETVDFGTGKMCASNGDATASLVNNACNGIYMNVKIGADLFPQTKGVQSVSGHALAKGAYEKIEVVISYASGAARADGDFTVSFDNIDLTYSTVGTKLISFSINDYSCKAEPGMTFWDFYNSEYNVWGFRWASSCDVLYLLSMQYGDTYQIEDGAVYNMDSCD